MLNISTNPSFSGRHTAADASYPYGSAKNSTGVGVYDGLPYIKSLVDDILGLQQALMSRAGIVPTGSSDTALACQQLDAMLLLTTEALVSSITVTVGATGDYLTVNEAFEYLSGRYPKHIAGVNPRATIELEAGFVMQEVVNLSNGDYSWITITGIDPVTTIFRSSLGFTDSAFMFTDCVAPRIAQQFNMDTSGTADQKRFATYTRSKGFISNGGCTNTPFYGIRAEDSDLVISGGDNSGGVVGLSVENSRVKCSSSADFSSCSYRGISAVENSNLTIHVVDASGAGTNGLHINRSTVSSFQGNYQKGGSPSSTDVTLGNGSIFRSSVTTGGVNIATNVLTSSGIYFS